MSTADLSPITRRALLGGATAAGAAALVGCQVDTGESAQAPSGVTEIHIPDYSTELPTEPITFRWLESSGLKVVFSEAVLDAFTAKHPNITTDYQPSAWDVVNQVVPLGIRNGSAPDVFALPQNVLPSTAVGEGWIQPIEDLIPDFDAWRANFPETAFVPGVHVFDGRVYTWPLSSDKRLEFMSIYDAKNMAAAGYDDPASQITTWDELYAALKKVVANDNVGMMIGFDALASIVSFLARTAGWRTIDGMDPLTGEYRFHAPEVVAAFEFLQKLATDKLLVPGFLSLKVSEARAQFSAGRSGMIFNGPWDIPAWKKTAPDWGYSIAPVPSPDGGDYVVNFVQNGANMTYVYAKSKYPTVAGQIMAYMGSPEGQKLQVVLSEGNLTSLQSEVNEAADQTGLLDANAKVANELALSIMREGPHAAIRNPDVAKVALVRKQVQPTWRDLMAGIFTGELTDPQRQFANHSAAQQESLEEAIATAKEEGADVALDDWIFPNWNPDKDYTKADYEAL